MTITANWRARFDAHIQAGRAQGWCWSQGAVRKRVTPAKAIGRQAWRGQLEELFTEAIRIGAMTRVVATKDAGDCGCKKTVGPIRSKDGGDCSCGLECGSVGCCCWDANSIHCWDDCPQCH